MSDNRLPQETIDYILDFLREEPKTLKKCCLVSKSWIPRVRKHLFRRISLKSPSHLEAWMKVFPGSISSPGHFTRILCIGYAGGVAAVLNSCLIQTFSHVVQLEIRAPRPPLSASHVSEIIRSLPLLEDLQVRCVGVYDDDEGDIIFQPLASPPLTGKLGLCLAHGIGPIAERLLDLPNGIRFREFVCAWYQPEDPQLITALVEGCVESLERVDIECETHLGKEAASVDLSKAIRLREVALRLWNLGDAWAGPTLKTLTSRHKDLQLISIYITFDMRGIEAETLTLWADLERTLIQLWESKAVTIRVKYDTDEQETETRELVEQLLPEATRRGIVELVDCSIIARWLTMATMHGL